METKGVASGGGWRFYNGVETNSITVFAIFSHIYHPVVICGFHNHRQDNAEQAFGTVKLGTTICWSIDSDMFPLSSSNVSFSTISGGPQRWPGTPLHQ